MNKKIIIAIGTILFVQSTRAIDENRGCLKRLYNRVALWRSSAQTQNLKKFDVDNNHNDGEYLIDANQNTCDIADIAQSNMETFAGIKDPELPKTQAGDPAKFIAYFRPAFLNATEKATRKQGFTILSNNPRTKSKTTVIDATTRGNLKLISSNTGMSRDMYLGHVITNNSNLELGKTYLLGILGRPTNNFKTLVGRQQLLKQLIAHDDNGVPQLTHNLQQHLCTMRTGEAQLLSFWYAGYRLPECINKQFFSNINKKFRTLDKSALALDVWSSWTQAKKGLNAGVQAASTVLLPIYAWTKLTGLPETPEAIDQFTTRFIGSAGGAAYAAASAIPLNTVQGTTALFAGIWAGMGIENTLKWFKADLSVEAVLQNKLVSIAHYYRNMKYIYELLCEYHDITKHLEHFKDLETCLNNQDVQQLFATLESRTFNANADWFFRRGNVLKAFNILHSDEIIKEHLEKALIALAEIDAYVAIATLYNTHKGTAIEFCMPTYVRQETPRIELTAFWHPLLKQKAITNSINLGIDHGNPNIIITGPNAAGKTTIATSIPLALILAQSIGIAPASVMTFTPFDAITSHMEIKDTLEKSTYQADLARSQEALNKMHDGLNFIFYDEPFKSTNSKEGAALAQATLEKIGSETDALCVAVTHYQELSDFAAKSDRFKNYKVDLILDGNMLPSAYPRQLEPGASEQCNLNLAIATANDDGYDQTITREAHAALEKKS